MTSAFDCRTTAAFLRSALPASYAAHVGGIAAFAHRPSSALGYALIAVSLLAWTAVIYFSIRAKLDAELFDMLADDPARAAGRLDFFLASARLVNAPADSRSIEDRIAGGIGLWKRLLASVAVQLLSLAAAVLLQL